jgi:hypothetical protein
MMRRGRDWRKSVGEERDRRKKKRCGQLARRQKRRGVLEQRPCELCLSTLSEMHHPDYNLPTMVRWLCHRCHMQIHASERRRLKLLQDPQPGM